MKFVFKNIVVQENDSVILVNTNSNKVIALRFETILSIGYSEKPDQDKRITPVFGIRHSQKEAIPDRSHFMFTLNTGLDLTLVFDNAADYRKFYIGFSDAVLNSRECSYLFELLK